MHTPSGSPLILHTPAPTACEASLAASLVDVQRSVAVAVTHTYIYIFINRFILSLFPRELYLNILKVFGWRKLSTILLMIYLNV